MEAAEVNVIKLQNEESATPINHIKTMQVQPRAQQAKGCYCCGGNDHAPAICQFKMYAINAGHLARVCKSTEKTESRST